MSPRTRNLLAALTILAFSGMIVGTAYTADAQSTPPQPAAQPAPQPPEPKPDIRRVQFTVYKTLVARSDIPALDEHALADAAAQSDGIAAALKKIGDTSLVYLGSHVIDLRSAGEISISASTPVYRKATPKLQANDSISYQGDGCLLNYRPVYGRQTENYICQLEVELSATGTAILDADKNITAPIYHKIAQLYTGRVNSSDPIVLLSVDGARTDQHAVAFVTHIQFSEPAAD